MAKCIGVLNYKGGTGKTTLGFDIAEALGIPLEVSPESERGKRVFSLLAPGGLRLEFREEP